MDIATYRTLTPRQQAKWDRKVPGLNGWDAEQLRKKALRENPRTDDVVRFYRAHGHGAPVQELIKFLERRYSKLYTFAAVERKNGTRVQCIRKTDNFVTLTL